MDVSELPIVKSGNDLGNCWIFRLQNLHFLDGCSGQNASAQRNIWASNLTFQGRIASRDLRVEGER
jgi:hypothetical protein